MILFCVNPYLSHFKPTLSVARALRDAGSEVIYMGFEVSREWVEKEKFKFIALHSCNDSDLKKLKKNHLFEELAYQYEQLHNEIIKIIRSYKDIKLMLLHISRFETYFLPAFKCGIEIVTYDTSSGSSAVNVSIPPTTSSVIPKFKCDISCIYAWVRRFIRKTNDLKWKKLKKYYPYNKMQEVSKQEGYRWKFCIDGFYLKVPHFKLGVKELEFKHRDNIYYAGLCLDLKKTQENMGFQENNKKHIYCSLGTMSYRYLRTDNFLRTLIEIARQHQEWELIISLGKKETSMKIGSLPSHIRIFDFVNQQSILEKADLVITHGGYGTIKECIYNEVPMIVCPSSYDQHGNAARVYYHRIGLRNNLLKKNFIERITKKKFPIINSKLLEKQIKEVVGNKSYKENIVKINQEIELNNDLECLIKFLISIEKGGRHV